jgi:hydrogenase maturation protease
MGIGSPAGDDQAGWLTIDALAASGVHAGADVIIEKLDRPGANLITLLENASWVILVDAMQSNGKAGEIRNFDLEDWAAYSHGLSSHGFGVLDALSLARELGNLPFRLDLYGIEIGSASPGAAPGAPILAAAQRLARIIATELGCKPSALPQSSSRRSRNTN